MKLIDRKPKRLFAFGCSFTAYHWATWPEIVAYDLGIPMYNLARCGAGNQYIVNMIAQANEIFKFNSDDLIMVCWSGYMREDRWFDGGWQVAGSVHSNNIYDQDFVDRYMNPDWCFIRDFAAFSLIKHLLNNTSSQYHMFSMLNLKKPEMDFDQDHSSSVERRLLEIYASTIDSMLPDFETAIWNSDIAEHKNAQLEKIFNCGFSDWHPLIDEHYQYLDAVFDEHIFSSGTKNLVDHTHKCMIDYINSTSDCDLVNSKQFHIVKNHCDCTVIA